MVEEVRAAPTEDVLCPFGEHLVVAKGVYELSDLVGVDELGVAEGDGGHAKKGVDAFALEGDLALKFVVVA